ncbi:MAG: T9SS type A sorting domain-containing protein [Bacteroidota bacterium]
MKNKILTSLLVLCFVISVRSAIVTVNNSGFTYTPANITINLGDTVNFSISSSHNAVEVSQATYNANGSTALPGGFSIGFGGGTLTQLTVGTHYYVCTPHAGMGMKGTITVVNNNTGTSLTQNLNLHLKVFPNPANDKIGINYSMNMNGKVAVRLFDLTGKMVALLFDDERVAGSHYENITLDRNKFGSGFYFVEINCLGRKITRQIILE